MPDQAEKFSFVGSIASQCTYCKHLAATSPKPYSPACSAFQEGIPEEILANEFDHRGEAEGDNGVRFEPRKDVPEPVLEALYRELDATHGKE